MASKILRLDTIPEQTVIHETVDALRRGELVVFPTETVYGLGCLASRQDAVHRLITAKGRRSGHALPVAVSGYPALKRLVPNLGTIGCRLARRCWPGPVTIVADTSSSDSPIARLPELCRQAVMPSGSTGFRVPDQPVVLKILQEAGEPVILTSANLSGSPPAVCAAEAMVGLGDAPDLILDAGTAHFRVPSTVVSVVGPGYEVLREGVLTKEKIERLTAKMILFVCTGNTCRSPMAEVIFSDMLAGRLGCSVEDLPRRGYVVMSAGTSANRGSATPQAAREVISELGLSLDDHRSQPLNEYLLRCADSICVVSRSHLNVIIDLWPGHRDRVTVLEGISDPVGGTRADYIRCAEEVRKAVADKIDELLDEGAAEPLSSSL
ncbi:MAG: threonylcarbamoyl-AMP synthase [Thermoguttaceae bacterium]|nr:threonylcarbamoyl-AMP synthase [Thermoguttaceae bacterium]